jgi:3-dehydroquinate synthase
LIYDPEFYELIRKNLNRILTLEPETLSMAIARAIKLKATVIARDEYDRLGIREALNFGHTFGHALESVTHYGFYQHGEAVIWGMRFALALSEVRGLLKHSHRMGVDEWLAALPVPPLPEEISASQLFAIMRKDKKSRNGKIHFVLLKKTGKTLTSSDVTERELGEAYRLIKTGVPSG